MAKNIHGYHLTQAGKVIPDEGSKQINFEQLKMQLLSTKITDDKLPREISFLDC